MIVLSEQSRQAVEDNDVDISPPQYSPSGRLVMIGQARRGLGCGTSDRLDTYRAVPFAPVTMAAATRGF